MADLLAVLAAVPRLARLAALLGESSQLQRHELEQLDNELRLVKEEASYLEHR